MQRVSPLDSSPAIRAALGVFALAFGILCWYAIVNGTPGPLSRPQAIGAVLVNLGGFVALRVARTPARPLGPVRLTLGIAIGLSLLLILSMPLPPRPETIGSDVLLGAIIVVAVSAQVLLGQRPQMAAGVLALLALLGVICEVPVVTYLGWAGVTPDTKAAAAQLSFIGSACVAALTLAWPRRDSASSSRLVS